MKLGDRIKADENVKNLWKACGDNEELLEVGFRKILWQIKLGRKQFHASLRELHPEFDDWELTYYGEDNTVILTEKRRIK